MVTVAIRRVNLDRSKESLLDFIDPKKYFLLPNTAGCYSADEAIRAARLGREVGLSDWVKIEVIGDQRRSIPTWPLRSKRQRFWSRKASRFCPTPWMTRWSRFDWSTQGASAVMPLGAPIGSGMGIQNTANLRILRETITLGPLIVDAGVGTPSDAAIAMELGFDGVLMNTGVPQAANPLWQKRCEMPSLPAGKGILRGRMARKLYATASSPLEECRDSGLHGSNIACPIRAVFRIGRGSSQCLTVCVFRHTFRQNRRLLRPRHRARAHLSLPPEARIHAPRLHREMGMGWR